MILLWIEREELGVWDVCGGRGFGFKFFWGEQEEGLRE